MPERIVFVCRDVGGANALLPVADLLNKKNQIRWLVQEDGRGKDVLKNLGRDFEIYSFSGQASKDNIAAVVSSMCSKAGQDLARHFKGFCPIIAIQDQWTAGLNDIWTDPCCRPDYILVNDRLDRNFVLKTWPGYGENRVVITGYPALDKYVNLDINGIKTSVKKRLSLIENKPIVLFAGQWWQTGHAITELIKALNDLRLDIYLIARPHPAMKDNTPEELPLWNDALANFKSGTLVDSSSVGISDVIAVSDLVLSMYSTTLNEAAILRLPNIAILYPGYGLKVYQDVSKLYEYPMVSLGCTAKAQNREELKRLVRTALTGDLGLRSAQEETFHLDGKNALRAAEFILSLL